MFLGTEVACWSTAQEKADFGKKNSENSLESTDSTEFIGKTRIINLTVTFMGTSALTLRVNRP